MKSFFDDHDFGGLDQCRRNIPRFQAHFPYCVSRDDGVYVLIADRNCDLRHEAAGLDINHATDQLVTAADLAKVVAARFNRAF